MPTPEAIEARAQQLLDEAGITSVPVSVEALCDYLGVEIRLAYSLPQACAGFAWRGLTHPVIVVNGNHPATRRRFTIAHELGEGMHLLGHTKSIMLSCDVVRDLDHEHAMDYFAACILMPACLVRQAWEQMAGCPGERHIPNATFRRLCTMFDVSLRAMSLRLREVGEEIGSPAD